MNCNTTFSSNLASSFGCEYNNQFLLLAAQLSSTGFDATRLTNAFSSSNNISKFLNSFQTSLLNDQQKNSNLQLNNNLVMQTLLNPNSIFRHQNSNIVNLKFQPTNSGVDVPRSPTKDHQKGMLFTFCNDFS